MQMHRNVKRTGWNRLAVAVPGLALLTLLALLAACSSQERPVAPASLAVPTQWGVNTVDIAGVFATVRQYLEDAGLKSDRDRTDSLKGRFVSQPVRCAPNADERHVAMCIFTAEVAASKSNPQQVAVDVRVRVGALVKYDPKLARDQIPIEPTLDAMVTKLRARYTFAEVTRTESLSF